MRSIIVLFLLSISISCYSQGKLLGNVYIQNSGWSPVEGIKINVDDFNGDYTKSLGEFTLNFPSLKPGDVVYASIGNNNIAKDKNGQVYELVNYTEIRAITIPNDPEKQLINVIVCPKGSRHKAAVRYYNILNDEKNRQIQVKEKELKRLRQNLSISLDSINTLQRTIDNYKKINDSITLFKDANYFAGINRDGASGRIIRFLNSLLANKSIEEARKELNIAKALKEAELGYNSLNSSIEEIKINAKILVRQFKVNEAISQLDSLELIVKKKNVHPILEFDNYLTKGTFKYVLNRNDEAISDLKNAESILISELNSNKFIDKLFALNDTFSIIYFMSYNVEEALKYLKKNQALFESMEESQNKKYLGFYANSLANLGLHHFKDKNFLEAERYFKKAKEINKKNKYPSNEEILLFGIIEYNLAVIQSYYKVYNEALDYLDKALKFYNTYKKLSNDAAIDKLIAQVLKQKGIIYKEEGKYDASEAYFKKALKLTEDINFGDKLFNHEIAGLHKALGDLYFKQGKDSLARIQFNKSAILLEPMCIDKEIQCSELANSLTSLAASTNNIQESIDLYLKAIKIFDNLKAEWILDYNYEAYARKGLADRYYEIEAYDKSEIEFFNSMALYSNSDDFDKNSYNLAQISRSLGKIEYKRKNYDDAVDHLERAIKLSERFLKSNNFKKLYNNICVDLGDVYSEQENYILAERAYKLPDIVLESTLNNGLNYSELLLHYRIKQGLGMSQMSLDKYKEAEHNLIEALKIKEEMISVLEKNSTKPVTLTAILDYKILAELMQIQLMLENDLSCIERGTQYINNAHSIIERTKHFISHDESLLDSLDSIQNYYSYYASASDLYINLLQNIQNLETRIEQSNSNKNKLELEEEVVSILEDYINNYPEFLIPKTNLSFHYGNSAWFSLFENDYLYAEKLAKKGLEADPNQIWINTNLALAFLLQNQLDKAKIIYKNLWYIDYIEGEKNYKDVFLEDIVTLKNHGINHKNFDKVITYLNKLEIENLSNIEMANQNKSLVNQYIESNNYELAIESSITLVNLYENIKPKPINDIIKTYRSLATTYTKLNNFEKALEYQLLSHNIVEEELYYDSEALAKSYSYTASAFDNAKIPSESLRYNEKAMHILKTLYGPDNLILASSYYNIAINYYDLKNYSEAVIFHHKSLYIREKKLEKNDPKLLSSYYNLALSQFSDSNYESALQNFKYLLDFTESYNLHNRVGLCYYYLKDYKNAISEYLNASSLSEEYKNTLFYNNIGTAYVKSLQFEKAFEAFKEYETLNPNTGRVYRNWAMYYSLRNDRETALANLQKALDLGFDDINWINSDDSLKSIKSDARFIAMIEKLDKN